MSNELKELSTPDEKLILDNMSIRANALANLSGFETYAEEKPGEWEKFLSSHRKKKSPPSKL
ncbi:hypothetical protein COT02_05375 [Candidatus Roizmanbacteria bacterium CG07_land_8_20_14_0_80_34_15]|uniref:Uncharacterized protein n=1 Tax=Candidatus Roizmanbacteria bacterium CG07_land_8_20_14_0_80_34_15 TaxID=1974849 RepID=A0A2M6YSU4_9BACT|nr:MAG: hypothetical protein COT02_05375 [Candidatus Roizmanbacteria bacterium CG07_land_8_20_14_0_80_34_15]